MRKYIGLDIGGTKCAVSLGCTDIDGNMKIIDKIKFPTNSKNGAQQTLDSLVQNTKMVIAKNNLQISDVQAIGISCGGPLDSQNGVIMSPPNLIGWDNIHITKFIESKFSIKTGIQNDANASALAEWKFGAAKGFDNAVFITFGTGLGAGLILNGRLYSGANDMAGEIGHIRLENFGPVGYGKVGSFEGFCSGNGIAQIARTKILEKLQSGQKNDLCNNLDELNLLDAKTVGDAAKTGDELAIEIYNICGEYLGKGLSIIIDILNPEIIVIGGVFARSHDLLWNSALNVIEKECLCFSKAVCKVVPSDLGENIGDYAALAVAAYLE